MSAEHLYGSRCCTAAVQIADAEWCGSFVRDAALRGVLRHIHSAICLLYGSIQTLLTQQARNLTSNRR